MIDRTLSHYAITAKLGEGGMGEVWRATDTALNREVAVKVLPAEMAADPDRLERFKREAQAIAALNHPNIVTIYSVEEADGVHLLTMELIEGKSLDQILPAGGLETDRLFPLAIQIADALAKAHDKGVIHRDLKPANVMVDGDGRVKILDFGLAKLAEQDEAVGAETELMTQAGMILGTVPYMSPEQVQAKPVDHRSDIFSLGILLHEMATGQRPFVGDNPASVISAILKDQPPLVTEVKADLPNHLGRIVRRCLEKDPALRYQSAKNLHHELETLRDEVKSGPGTVRQAPPSEESLSAAAAPSEDAVPPRPDSVTFTVGRRRLLPVAAVAALAAVALGWWLLAGRGDSGREEAADRSSAERTASVQSDRPRLVVIPFENQGLPDDDYFAAGMTEEITSRLAAVPGLAVISRKSALQYAGTDKTPTEIGEELDVAYVLDGTVRWASSSEGGSRVRITPQLNDVAAGTLDWSEPFDREVEDVFALQTEIAKAVVSELGVAVLGGADAVVEERPTASFEAYRAFLLGNHLGDKADSSAEALNAKAEAFARAVELDPDFGEAWAKLTQAHAQIYHHGYDVSQARQELAREALAQADRLAPDSGETLLAHGYYHYWGFKEGSKEYERAAEFFRRARAVLVDPSDALAAEAWVVRRLGRFDEAVALLDRALENNPRHEDWSNEKGVTLTFARRYAEAVDAYRLAQSIDPLGAGVFREAWTHWIWKGAEGLADARAALDRVPADPSAGDALFHLELLFYEGREERVLEVAEGLLGEFSKAGWTHKGSLLHALALERLGRVEKASAAYRGLAESLERWLERHPDDNTSHGILGYAYAALGRPEDALASAERGVEMMPLERDALAGSKRLYDLAIVNARLGKAETAIEQCRTLIELSGLYSVPLLEIDFFMDPVREHPKYEELVRELG